MGHGTPLATVGANGCGMAGPFMLEAGISSTRHIAAFWGLSGQRRAEAAPRGTQSAVPLPVVHTARLTRMPDPSHADAKVPGVGKIIEDALRAAGLMR
jgi:hypothetical protein